MGDYLAFKHTIKHLNQELRAAIEAKNGQQVHVLLQQPEMNPFTTRYVHIRVNESFDDLIFTNLRDPRIRAWIDKIVSDSLNQAVLQQNLHRLFYRQSSITLPLRPAMLKILRRRRFLILSGMEFPNFIEVLPPRPSILHHAIHHFEASIFGMLLDSYHMNVFNLMAPGKLETPLTYAIKCHNQQAVKMILECPHMSLALLARHKQRLEKSSIGQATMLGQDDLVQLLLDKANALYQSIFSIDCHEQATPASLFYFDRHGHSLLSIAAKNNCISTIGVLLTRAHPYQESFPSYFRAAMKEAIHYDQSDAVQALIDSGAYPTSHREVLTSSMAHPELKEYVLYALEQRSEKCLKTLFDSVLFQQHCLSNMASNIFLLKAVLTGVPNIVSLILTHPFFSDQREDIIDQRYPESHLNALHLAVEHKFYDIAGYLAKHFPDLLLRQDVGFRTPLLNAALLNDTRMLNTILPTEIIDTSIARLISNILQHPKTGIDENTIAFLRDTLILYDKRQSQT